MWCQEHGVVVEAMPWSEGKRPESKAMMQFLGNWARRLSWKETATIFKVSWQAVYRSVDWQVDWGLKHRSLDGITAIGIDEIHVGHGKKSFNYLTLIYEIDARCRRLLWVGRKRTAATLRKGLKEAFRHFWDYRSITWAGAFMRAWIQRVKRSRIAPMIKVANMLETHEGLILNWIRARREVFTGATEGLNNKARVVTRRSYGFRTFHVMELALYHTLGQLPEPEVTHKFW